MTPEQPTTPEVTVTTAQQLELGDHTLFVMSDGSVDILNLSGEPWSYLCENGIRLTSEEAYRLFISLKEVFK